MSVVCHFESYNDLVTKLQTRCLLWQERNSISTTIKELRKLCVDPLLSGLCVAFFLSFPRHSGIPDLFSLCYRSLPVFLFCFSANEVSQKLAQLLALISNSKTNLQTKKDLIAQLV
jgi:hypothetical protein